MRVPTKTFITASLLAIFPLFLNAQNLSKDKQKEPYLKVINSIFSRIGKDAVYKDSIALYAINFSIDLVKNNKGKVHVEQISANDTIGYKLFPSYKKLYSLDYKTLLGNKKRMKLVIPILISNVSATANKKYKKVDGSLLIDMDAAVNAAYSLYSTLPYNNSLDAKVSLQHRMYNATKNGNDKRVLMDITFLTPYFIQIVNIQ